MNTIMKTIKELLYGIAVLSSIVFIVSCNNEEYSFNKATPEFDELRFVVNVNKASNETLIHSRAASSKKDWAKGDEIIVAIDADDNNLCILTYVGNGKWTVSKVDEKTNFTNEQGKLCAVHADSLDLDETRILTSGDILFTQDGTYTKHDNVVVINLNMNQRPVSRIAIVGMEPSCWIEDLKEYCRLNSLSNMQWKNSSSSSSHGKYSKKISGDTCVFYGILESNKKGETTIRISESYGVSYERTYNKTVKVGEYIIIQGPYTTESTLWTKHTLVNSISLDKTELNLVAGDVSVINAIYNKDADNNEITWSSSNNNVATVDQNGNVKALSNGDARIEVRAKDGSASARCDVHVRNVVDFIDINSSITSLVEGVETTSIGYEISITNKYSKTIYLNKELSFSSSNTDVITHISEFSGSFSSINIEPTNTAVIRVKMLFSMHFKIVQTSNPIKQNNVAIKFMRKDDDNLYSITYGLPWSLY